MNGRKQPSSNRSPKRKLEIIRGMMRQILVGLKACHNTGPATSIVLHAPYRLPSPMCNEHHCAASEALQPASLSRLH